VTFVAGVQHDESNRDGEQRPSLNRSFTCNAVLSTSLRERPAHQGNGGDKEPSDEDTGSDRGGDSHEEGGCKSGAGELR
jgi:hypothetical protein